MFRKIVCNTLSADFAKCTEVVSFSKISPLRPSEVLVAPKFLGINASDVNFTAGRYKPNVKPPFDVGFECIGTVLAVGSRVTHVRPGDRVGTFAFGAFAEAYSVPMTSVAKLPPADHPNPALYGPQSVQLLVSGLTALLALRRVGELSPIPDPARRTATRVLVTAAAGATGMMAVQIAKASGAFVVGTTSSERKVASVKAAGADIVIVTSRERLRDAVVAQVPGGAVDIVYEGVGGELFKDAFDVLAVRGRLVVIGAMSGYKDGSCFGDAAGDVISGWPMKLLSKSASVRGFFLSHFLTSPKILQEGVDELVGLVEAGKLQLMADVEPGIGLEHVASAVSRLSNGTSVGKVVVTLPDMPEALSQMARIQANPVQPAKL